MGGGQVVADTALGTTANWTLAFADYHYENLNQVASKFLEPTSKNFNNQLANTNSFVKDANGKIIGFRSGFNLVSAASELNSPDPIGLGVPGGLFGEFAYNTPGRHQERRLLRRRRHRLRRQRLVPQQPEEQGRLGRVVHLCVRRTGRRPGDVHLRRRLLLSRTARAARRSVARTSGRTSCDSITCRSPTSSSRSKSHLINALDDHLNPSTTAFSPYKGNPTLVRTQLDAMLKF